MSIHPLLVYPLKFACLYKPSSPYKPPDIVRVFFVLISSFTSIIALEATFKYSPVFIQHSAPIIVPSWAATIILTCNALESPLGQPFNLFFGTLFSSVIGVGLTKLWMLHENNEETLWICGALALAISSVFMSHTKMVHPAAGSAALLCAINPTIRHMGWFYLVVQIVTALIVMAVGSIFANLYSQYPLYWLLPPNLAETRPIIATKPESTTSAYSGFTHVNDTSDKNSLYSLSRTQTATQESIATTNLASSVGHALNRAITESHYLQRIPTTNPDHLTSKFPTFDFESTALMSNSDFSFPTDLKFTAEDKGILISIQRKLDALRTSNEFVLS